MQRFAIHRAGHANGDDVARRLLRLSFSSAARYSITIVVPYFGGFTTIYVTWLPCVVG
jgi:hypothetical protein